MSEWLKEHAWKACVGETLPWVRIPLSPPVLRNFLVNSHQGLKSPSPPPSFVAGRCWTREPLLLPPLTPFLDGLNVEALQSCLLQKFVQHGKHLGVPVRPSRGLNSEHQLNRGAACQ